MLRALNIWLTIRQVYMKRMSTAITYYSYRNSKNILNCCHTCHWIDKTAIGDRLRTFSWSRNIYVVLNTWWFSQSTMCLLFSPCSIVYKHEPKRTLQLQTLFKATIIKYSIWKYRCLTNKNIFLSKIVSKKFIITSTNHFQTWSYIYMYLFYQSLSNVIIYICFTNYFQTWSLLTGNVNCDEGNTVMWTVVQSKSYGTCANSEGEVGNTLKEFPLE